MCVHVKTTVIFRYFSLGAIHHTFSDRETLRDLKLTNYARLAGWPQEPPCLCLDSSGNEITHQVFTWFLRMELRFSGWCGKHLTN